jgi:hypothetical protein
MPIRPENRGRYPKDWPEISRRIRFERARGQCKARQGEPHPVTGSKVILTVAHLNHTPEDCRDENLAAMCQRCHLHYDRKLHEQNRLRNRRCKETIPLLPD